MAKKDHGHHGGSWKVAYADFVTAMMALFLCLWLTSQDQKIKEAVERAFRNPFSSITKESSGIIPNKDASSTFRQQGKFTSISAVEIETMHHLQEDLEKLLKDQNQSEKTLRIDVTTDGLNINVFDRTQKPIFHPDTDIFTEYGAWVFNTLAWEIARYNNFRIELQGHTEAKTNDAREGLRKWELSTERANAARRKVVAGGVAIAQISEVSGFADTRPLENTAPGDESNRRVTVRIKIKESVEAPDALRANLPYDAAAN